jgi:hypothetical protein|tara:strand:+ start:145 stop:471 length:327 start_codon:yes stop_codon:yes gene_type:complete
MMTEKEIYKLGEIQYLKGRLDELHKTLPTISNINRQRELDQRMEKYYEKLKKVDEVSYFLYMVELKTRLKSKKRSKKDIKSLLEEVLGAEMGINDDLKVKILKKLESY